MRNGLAWGLVLAMAGCGGTEAGGGTLRVLVEAEDTITQGIPARMGSGEGFEDGWSLQYEFFYVNIGRVTIADAMGHQVNVPTSFATGERVFDLKAASQSELFTVMNVPARRYDRVSYRTPPVSATTSFADGIPADRRAAMMGFSTWIRATATKPGRTPVTIDWKFAEGYQYRDCEGPADRPGLGTVVAEGGTTTLRLTIHGDHWYWQTLGAEGSPTRFDPIANADTSTAPYRGNGDGLTTLEELDMVDLASVPAPDGHFNPSGRPVTTLGAYMRATTGTNGHIDGDGVCGSSRL
jgi:hypothetical protein